MKSLKAATGSPDMKSGAEDKVTSPDGTGRMMGLDFGSKTVGVAISDPLGITAQGITIIRRERENKLRKTYSAIEELIEKYDVKSIVLGYPVLLSGKEGERVKATLAFKEDLERRTGLPVILQDERLTTIQAHRSLDEMGVKSEKHGEYVDEVAAVLILQSYLDRQRNSMSS